MTKRPKSIIIPTPKKTPKKAPQNLPEKNLDKNPSWLFKMLDLGGSWGWKNIGSKEILLKIVEKLRHFESMTWAEIDKKNTSHLIPLDKLSKGVRKRLEELRLDDHEMLYSLRLSGKQRIWGIRLNGAFNLLWWDPDHTVYPVKKKHT